MFIYTFEEFGSILDNFQSINVHNSYIQWESEVRSTNISFKDFEYKEGNKHIRRIICLFPSKDKVVLIDFNDLFEEYSSSHSSVYFNKINYRITDNITKITNIKTQERLEIACELYKAQSFVMSILSTNRILVLEDCYNDARRSIDFYENAFNKFKKIYEDGKKSEEDNINKFSLESQKADIKLRDVENKYNILLSENTNIKKELFKSIAEFTTLSKKYHKLGNAFMDLEDAYYGHKKLDQSLGTIKSILNIGTTVLKVL